MIFAIVALCSNAQKVEVLSGSHCMVRLDATSKYILLPIEEKSELSNIRLIAGTQTAKTLNVRLAVGSIDYYVPLDISAYKGQNLKLDIHINGEMRQRGTVNEYVCWKNIRQSDTFDTTNRETLYRPQYHHTPAWGWMNDPNGLFYNDGLWHLYYQWNPYGSQWENIHWGHSVSRDLTHWQNIGVGIEPDALGTIFSGCCVIDRNNTAGFGENAVVAMFTSAAESQTQSIAYSNDGGMTFTKYEGNPVIVADVPDFRDPHIFWNSEISKWNLILAAGQEMRIYTSANLKDWTYESSFGQGYGCHDGVWECPDLVKLPVEGFKAEQKWMLICNINPGGPAGGSATQYFIGTFDGHKFTTEQAQGETRWMDYGKDHYAAVTFDNAPDGRHVMIGWMSNWHYANEVPTRQYRSANTIARDLYLFDYEGKTYAGQHPVREMLALRAESARETAFSAGEKCHFHLFDRPQGAYEVVINLNPKKGEELAITLSNDNGEEVVMAYNDAMRTFTMDRRRSGQTSFSDAFAVETSAPVLGGAMKELRLFIDNSSIEAFINDGKTTMSNIVFPSSPYNTLTVSGKKGSKISSLTVYKL